MAADRGWIEREPSAGDALQQLARLVRRALKLPFRTLLVTALVGLSVVGIFVLKGHKFAPRYLLRVVEAQQDRNVAPTAKRELRQYVLLTVFSNGKLLDLINKHGLYPNLARHDPNAAVNSFREDIDVEVYRNYFVEERSSNGPPRSARIAVHFRSDDRQKALAVTRDLGALIAEHEAAARREQATSAVTEIDRSVSSFRREYENKKRMLAEKLLAVSEVRDPKTLVEIADVGDDISALDTRLVELEARKAELELGAAYEAKRMGLRFDVIEEGSIPASEGIDRRDAILLGLVTFLVGLPFVAIAVAAFDTKIRSPDDLKRLGIRPLGALRLKSRRRGVT